jgi:hypothetical protein
MNSKELINFLETSPFSLEIKQKIKNLIGDNETISVEAYALITDIIQKEIDIDLADVVLDSLEQEKLDRELSEGLDVVEKELAEDMSFVESELDELDKISHQISDQEDQIAIQKIKQDLA